MHTWLSQLKWYSKTDYLWLRVPFLNCQNHEICNSNVYTYLRPSLLHHQLIPFLTPKHMCILSHPTTYTDRYVYHLKWKVYIPPRIRITLKCGYHGDGDYDPTGANYMPTIGFNIATPVAFFCMTHQRQTCQIWYLCLHQPWPTLVVRWWGWEIHVLVCYEENGIWCELGIKISCKMRSMSLSKGLHFLYFPLGLLCKFKEHLMIFGLIWFYF